MRAREWTVSTLMLFVSVVCAVVAVIVVIFEVDNAKVYPTMVAAAIGFLAASFLLP